MLNVKHFHINYQAYSAKDWGQGWVGDLGEVLTGDLERRPARGRSIEGMGLWRESRCGCRDLGRVLSRDSSGVL